MACRVYNYGKSSRLGKDEVRTWYGRALRHVYALIVVVVGWVMFRASSLGYAWEYIQVMFGIIDNHGIPKFDYGINVKFALALGCGLLLSMPLMRNILNVAYERKVLRGAINVWLFVLLFLSTISLAASTYNPFIYFRF